MYIKGHLDSLISLSQKPNFYLISIFKTQFKVEVSIIKLENRGISSQYLCLSNLNRYQMIRKIY